MTLTKREYQRLHSHLGRLLPPGGRPLTTEEVVDVGELQSKLERVIEAIRPRVEKGERVLSWRIPRDQAPTMNEYAYMKGWQKTKRRQQLDTELRALLPQFPKAELHGAQHRRWVRVTRFSTQRVDDLSVDVLGGKLPVDSLVRCGVLVDDNEAFMIREPRWESTKRGNTHVLVEVFAVVTEGDTVDGPKDAKVEQIRHELGPMTRAIVGG